MNVIPKMWRKKTKYFRKKCHRLLGQLPTRGFAFDCTGARPQNLFLPSHFKRPSAAICCDVWYSRR